jgi:UDP-glucose 4-epimerase
MAQHEKVLVTGGAGYIGSHTIIELIERMDCDVVSVDNFANSDRATFDRIERITGRRVFNHEVDLCDQAAVDHLFEKEAGITGVIHFAAFKSVPESVSDPYKYYHNNIASLLSVLQACLRHRVHRFIFSSSCSVYGNIDQLPVSEDTPMSPAESPYGFTKQIGERILQDYARGHRDLRLIALRYFNPVGAHHSGLIGEAPINPPSSLVPVITMTAIGKRSEVVVHGNDYGTRDGTCIRDYVHVSDIAAAHVAALALASSDKMNGPLATFNLGTGDGVSVLEAIAAFESASGVELNHRIGPRREGDVEAIYSDTTMAETELQWKAERGLHEMMRSAWVWEQNSSAEQAG